jgi:hypothetical protein
MWEYTVESPGVGMYDATKLPNGEHSRVADMRGEAAGYAFKTTMPRIAKQGKSQTGSEIGPGSYDINKQHNGLSWAMVDNAGELNSGTSAFMSDVDRADPVPSKKDL